MADLLPKDFREVFEGKEKRACDVYIGKKCKREDNRKVKMKECRDHCTVKTRTINYDKCENGFLLMNRFLSGDIKIENDGYEFDTKGYLKSFHQAMNDELPMHKAIKEGMYAIDMAKEQEEAIGVMEKMNLIKLKSFHCKQEWHMVVGIGGNTVSEVGMTLHFINGVPFIPGQGIKGCLRHSVIQQVFEGDEKKAYKDEKFVAVFGSEQSQENSNEDLKAGNIIFYDAYPLNKPTLVKDIMTNHNEKYYQGKNQGGNDKLTDAEQPNPVQFYCIKNTEFKFYIGVRKILYGEYGVTSEELLDTAAQWFEMMLEYNGLGAKTSVGYGYFNRIEEEKLEQEEKKAKKSR